MNLKKRIYRDFLILTLVNFFVFMFVTIGVAYLFWLKGFSSQWESFADHFLKDLENWKNDLPRQAEVLMETGWDARWIQRQLRSSYLSVVALFQIDGTLIQSWQEDEDNRVAVLPLMQNNKVVTLRLSDSDILEKVRSKGSVWTYQPFYKRKIRLSYFTLWNDKILELSIDLNTSQLRFWGLAYGLELALWDNPKRPLIASWPMDDYRALGLRQWPNQQQWQQWFKGLWLFHFSTRVHWGENEFRLHGYRAINLQQEILNNIWFWFVLALIGVFPVVILMGYSLAKAIVDPLQVLQLQSQKLFLGQETTHFTPTGVDQIDELGFKLEQLSVDVQNYKKSLEQKIQELHQTQASLVQAEKMNTLGLLASSLAHEINNPLSVVKSHIYLLKQQPLTGAALESVLALENAVSRVAQLTHQMLKLAYQQNSPQARWVDVKEIVDSALALLKGHLQKYQISFQVENLGDSVWVWFTADDLIQVLLNLILNSVDASSKGSQIILSWQWQDSGGCLYLDDEGSGIPAEIIPHVFEPFFTTKPQGKGTGLGLYICKTLCQRYQANIWIESPSPRWQKGTRVSICFPQAYSKAPETNVT